MHFSVLPIIFLSLVVGLSGCTKKGPTPKKKSITIGLSQEPDSLFAPFQSMMASEEVFRVGNYTLTVFDENWKLIPWAATDIPTKENGKLELFEVNGQKKMRTTWQIRDEFFWPDGTPLTADDFLFAFEIYKDPTLEVIDRTIVEKIEKMESKGDKRKTLVVTWKEPYAYYHNYRQHEALPKHLLAPIYKASFGKLSQSKFGQAPALAGSYTIKEWVPGNYLIAEKNSFATGFLRANFDEVIWRIIPQSNTLESNLLSGSIDAISPVSLSLDQALLLEKSHKDKFDFFYTPGLVWEHIDFNLENPILKDKRVRHALAFGADREGIVKLLFDGRQPVAHGTEPPKSPYFNGAVAKYPYDAEKAKKLLDDAGWKQGENGIRVKDGKPLTLLLMTTSGDKTRERIEQLLQAQWRSIGVDIQIRNQPAKVFFGQTMRMGEFPALAMYSWVKDPVAVSDTLWRCDYIPKKENNYMGQNRLGFCNKKADELLKSASLEIDSIKRAQIGRDFEALWADELPALPLFFRLDVSVTKKGLANWKPTGMLQPVTWNAAQWRWM